MAQLSKEQRQAIVEQVYEAVNEATNALIDGQFDAACAAYAEAQAAYADETREANGKFMQAVTDGLEGADKGAQQELVELAEAERSKTVETAAAKLAYANKQFVLAQHKRNAQVQLRTETTVAIMQQYTA